MEENIKSKTIFGIAWKTLENFLVNIVQAIIFLILARLLMPADFGVIAIMAALIGITNIFVNSGLGLALIQSEDIDEIDISSVLFFTMVIALVAYILLFLLSPAISEFFNEPVIESILRIYSISIIFSAINGVQKSILIRNLEFKKIFIITFFSTLTSGFISIAMAMNGYGVYALVFNSIFSGLLSTLFFAISMKWLPRLVFSIKRLIILFNYSYKLVFSNIIEVIYTNMFPLLIGKSIGTEILGYYNNGRQIPSLLASTINASISSVTFSVYSKYQNHRDKLRFITRETIIVSNFIILPIMAFIAALAEPIIVLILTDKWLPSVPFLQLFCIILGLHHQHNISLQAIAAIGRSDLFLKYQIFKKIIGILLLLVTFQFGIMYIVIGQLLASCIAIFLMIQPNKSILNYTIADQLIDFLPYLSITILMFFGVHIIGSLNLLFSISITLQVICGLCIYFGLAYILKLRGLNSFLKTLKTFF